MLARSLALVGAALLVGSSVAVPVGAEGAPPAVTLKWVAAPRAIRDITLSGDEPAMPVYVPIHAAKVAHELQAWLASATPAPAPALPPPSRHPVVLMDYLGPARLYFTDASTGRRLSVYPAYYLSDHGPDHAVTIHYFTDVVAYRYDLTGANGGSIEYVRAPALYRYLRDDSRWHRQFRLMGSA